MLFWNIVKTKSLQNRYSVGLLSCCPRKVTMDQSKACKIILLAFSIPLLTLAQRFNLQWSFIPNQMQIYIIGCTICTRHTHLWMEDLIWPWIIAHDRSSAVLLLFSSLPYMSPPLKVVTARALNHPLCSHWVHPPLVWSKRAIIFAPNAFTLGSVPRCASA